MPDYARILSSTQKQQPETPRPTVSTKMQAFTRLAAVTNYVSPAEPSTTPTFFGASLTDAINMIRECDDPATADLKDYLGQLAGAIELRDRPLQKARVAILVKLARDPEAVATVISKELVSDIQGRLRQIVAALQQVNVILLPGGALEHYLPSYSGHLYDLKDEAKRAAVENEISLLATGTAGDLNTRYRELLDSISLLPAKPPVDTDATLMTYLGDYVHELQGLVLRYRTWAADELNAHFNNTVFSLGRLFNVVEFMRSDDNEFEATISIYGPDNRVVHVSHETNAGMRKFQLETVPSRT